MKTYQVNEVTGWIMLPVTTEKVVAHFKNGYTEEFSLISFLSLKAGIKKQIVAIDCYDEND